LNSESGFNNFFYSKASANDAGANETLKNHNRGK
jgi:hypothetical protein